MTTENFKGTILPILEEMLETYKSNGDERLKEALDRYLSKYKKTPLPLECHNILQDLEKQKQKIDKKYSDTGIIKRVISKVGRRNFITGSAVVAMLLAGCAASRSGGATEESKDSDKKSGEIETILAGNKQVEHGSAWAENFAKNGAYDENAKESSDMFAIATVLDSFANRDQYANQYLDQLALGATYNSREEVQAVGRSFFEIHQQIVLSKGEIKYENVLQKEKDAKLLNDLQTAWKNMSATSSDESKEAYDKLIEDFVMHVNQYSPFAIRLGTDFVTMGYDTPWKGGTVVTQETIDTFYQGIQNYCTTIYATSDKDKEQQTTANSTLQSVSDTLLYGYVDDLLKDKEHIHEEKEELYSYTEIRDGIADKIKDLKNAEINLEEKAAEVSMENFEQKAIEKFGPVDKVSPSDKIITGENGKKVIDSGKTVTENSKGDEKDLGFKDQDNNKADKEDEVYWFTQGAKDYYAGHRNPSPGNASAYDKGWKQAEKDKQQSEQDKLNQAPKTENSTTEDHYNDNANQNKPQEEAKDTPKDETKDTSKDTSTPSKPETPEESKTSGGDEIVSEETTTEDIIWSNLGTDGQQYDMDDFKDISTNPELEGRTR